VIGVVGADGVIGIAPITRGLRGPPTVRRLCGAWIRGGVLDAAVAPAVCKLCGAWKVGFTLSGAGGGVVVVGFASTL